MLNVSQVGVAVHYRVCIDYNRGMSIIAGNTGILQLRTTIAYLTSNYLHSRIRTHTQIVFVLFNIFPVQI